MSSQSARCDISDLPAEIILAIFEYLSVHERKAVKLVSKSWLTCCNTFSLLDKEVLTCSKTEQLPDFYELLNKSTRQLLKVKFDTIKFHGGSSFWINKGLRIRSIDFIDCQFFNSTLEEILLCCENLFHLSFAYSNFYIIPDKDPFPLVNDLEKISGKAIVRENLNSLVLDITDSNDINLSDFVIHQLLLIFPKIKILKITSDFCSGEEIHLDPSELTNEHQVTMSPVLHYLTASSEQIEKLKLRFPWAPFSPNSLRLILETVFSLSRLTELTIETQNTAGIDYLGDCFNSKQLKSLKFGMIRSSSDLLSLLSLFDSNSSLQHLMINHSPSLEIPYRYTSFSITKHFYDFDSFGSCSVAQSKTILPSLSVWISRRMDDFSNNCLPFLQYYENLHHLRIDFVVFEDLQLLLKYQKKLRSLIIDYEYPVDHEYCDIGPDSFTFNELTDIEYLDLADGYVASFFLRTLLPETIFTKLKYIRFNSDLYLFEEEYPSILSKVADAMPFLEGIRLDHGLDISVDVVVELCTKLRQLRYLYYDGTWNIKDGVVTDEHYRGIFSTCPSLRALVHSCSKVNTYFYDKMNEKVILKEDANRHNLGEPRIGEFNINWLEF